MAGMHQNSCQLQDNEGTPAVMASVFRSRFAIMLKRAYSRMDMTVTLHFSEEIEQRLRGLATRAGLTLEGYVQSLAEREAAWNGGPPSASGELTPSQWSCEWRAWAEA